MTGRSFDLIVIGTGVAATTVAFTCRRAGWSVAIVDEMPFGGTCALRGCDPKKVLRRGAEVVEAARLMRGKGVADPGLAIDWPSLMAFKRTFTDPVPAKLELIRSTEEEKQSQLKRLREFHARHAKESPAMLERLRQAVIKDDNVFAVLMDAVRVCSLGQITHALFEVGGQYRRSM